MQRPLCIQGNIFAGGDVCLVVIARAGTVCLGIPAGEIIVRAGEGVGGQAIASLGFTVCVPMVPLPPLASKVMTGFWVHWA